MSESARIVRFPSKSGSSVRPTLSRRRDSNLILHGRYKVGALYRQPSGFWAARVIDLQTGESFKKSSGCRKKGDARKALSVLLKSEEPEAPQETVPTLDGALTQLYAVKEPDLSGHSRKDYQSSYDLFRERFGSNTLLTDVDYATVERYLSDRVKAGQRRTAQKHLMMLRSLMTWAVRRGWLTENPLTGLKAPRQQTKEFRLPTAEEAQRFLQACSQAHTRKAAALGFLTGLRLGTILSLRAADLDVENKVIRVDGTRMKAGKPIEMPVRDDLLALLLDGLPDDPDARLIGRRVNDNIKRSFDTARKSAGMEWLVFHSTRRWFASQLTATGCSYPCLKELMGHSKKGSGDVTLIYVTVEMAEKREAVSRLPTIL